MDRREEIICAASELAAENGLGSVSMQQIADKVGIKKPSLYNHFRSKEELVSAMYEYIRSKARDNAMSQPVIDAGAMLKTVTPAELLKTAVSQYMAMTTGDNALVTLYRVLYSERTTDPVAAQILAEESRRMTAAAKNLFYAIQIHGGINFPDIDIAAESFAFAVHGMIDYMMDCETAGMTYNKNMPEKYAECICRWFSEG